MGRRRKPRKQKREVVSITLDPEVLQAFDKTLGTRTRSRAIEGILKAFLKDKGQTTLTAISVIVARWECDRCSFAWETKDRSTDYIYCPGCTAHMNVKVNLKGQRVISLEEEE